MKFRLALALTCLAAITRLLPHPDNFTPIGAMALFGAAYFSHQAQMLVVPFLALFVSDLVLNNVIYSQYYTGFTFITSWWIYLAFALVMLTGWALLSQKVTPARLLFASLTASLLFFIVTNFSTWLGSGMYPRTPAGLTACFAAGLPFLRNTVLGDLFFSGVMFGAYEWMMKRQLAGKAASL